MERCQFRRRGDLDGSYRRPTALTARLALLTARHKTLAAAAGTTLRRSHHAAGRTNKIYRSSVLDLPARWLGAIPLDDGLPAANDGCRLVSKYRRAGVCCCAWRRVDT